jgi:hypothetical protein
MNRSYRAGQIAAIVAWKNCAEENQLYNTVVLAWLTKIDDQLVLRHESEILEIDQLTFTGGDSIWFLQKDRRVFA